MQDVARLAQVSLITVSRAINTPERVAPATLAAVRAAIRTSGYVHNLAASALASKHSRVIGAIVPTIDNSIFAETVRGLSETTTLSIVFLVQQLLGSIITTTIPIPGQHDPTTRNLSLCHHRRIQNGPKLRHNT